MKYIICLLVNNQFASTLFIFSIDGFEKTVTRINDDPMTKQNVPLFNEEKGPITDTSIVQSNNDSPYCDMQKVLSTTTSDLNNREDIDMQDLRKLDDAKNTSTENSGMFKRLLQFAVLRWMLGYE